MPGTKKSSTFPVNQQKEAKWGETNTKIERPYAKQQKKFEKY